jgi:type IV fimbrial biogenesis protein FimT
MATLHCARFRINAVLINTAVKNHVAMRMRGVTIVELIVTLAVIAIVTALGVPSMKSALDDYRSRTTMSALVSDLNLARVEAIKRNRRMIVCPRAGVGANPCSSAQWETGWVVCYINATGGCDVGTTDDPNPIRVTNPIDGQLALTGTLGSVTFTPLGTATSQVVLTLTSGKATRTATVAATGNVSSIKN